MAGEDYARDSTVHNAAAIGEGAYPDSLASVVGEERVRDGLKRRAHDSSRAMDGEARLSLARLSGLALSRGWSAESGAPSGFPACELLPESLE